MHLSDPETVRSFYEISAQILTAFVLAMSALVVLREKTKEIAPDARPDIRRTALLALVFIAAGFVIALLVLANPNMASQPTFTIVCAGLGFGLGVLTFAILVQFIEPNDKWHYGVWSFLVCVIPAACLTLYSIFADAPTL